MGNPNTNLFSVAGFLIVSGCSFLLFGLFFIAIEGSPIFLFLKIGGVALLTGITLAYGLRAAGFEEKTPD